MRHRFAVASVIGVSITVAASAHADPTDQDRALATIVFNEAKELLAEGKIPQACRKLEESRRLDPLPGTLLNLAACHEQEGRLATAFSDFYEARALAERDHRDDRVAFANEHLAAIEPRMSKLVIVVPPDADRPDLEIRRDNTVLGRAIWGTRIPIDPGEHIVEVSAPHKKTWRSVVNVLGDADVRTVTVTPLDDDAAEAVPPMEPARLAPLPDGPSEPHGLSTRAMIAIGSAGLGVIGLGLGTFLGLRAVSKHDDPGATCTTHPCSSESLSLNRQAEFAADASTVSFAVALVGLGAGALLWFGDSSARSKGVSLAPSWGPGRVGVDLARRF